MHYLHVCLWVSGITPISWKPSSKSITLTFSRVKLELHFTHPTKTNDALITSSVGAGRGRMILQGIGKQTAGAILREAALQMLVKWIKICELVHRTPCQEPLHALLFCQFPLPCLQCIWLSVFSGNSIVVQSLMKSSPGENFKQSATQWNVSMLLF